MIIIFSFMWELDKGFYWLMKISFLILHFDLLIIPHVL